MTSGLTHTEVDVLAFAKRTFHCPGCREAEIRRQFGWSLIRFQQVLNHLIDQPAAEAHDPLLVRRLRRLRDQHRAARTRTDQPS